MCVKKAKLFTIFILLLLAILTLSACHDGGKEAHLHPTQAPQNTGTPAGLTAPSVTPATQITPTPIPDPTPSPEPVDYSGGIVANVPVTVPLYEENFDVNSLMAECGTGQTIGVQFHATVPFYSIGIHSPTWAKQENFSVIYELYAWKEDYFTTTGGEPVLIEELTYWVDGQCAQFVFPDNMELPAGEYLLLAMYQSHAPLHDAGVWTVPGMDFSGSRAYKNDEVWDDVTVITTLFYKTTPRNLFGPLSDSGLE